LRFASVVQLDGSNWATAIIAYSRSDIIVNAMTPNFTKKKFWTLAIVTWLLSLITSLPPLVGWSSTGFAKSGQLFSCRHGVGGKGLIHALYYPIFHLVNYILPVVLTTAFLTRIIVVARKHWRPEGSNVVFLTDSGGRQLEKETTSQQIRRTIKSKAFR
jgi:hypothetical protein